MATAATAAATTPPPGRLGLPFLGESLGFLKNPFDFFEARFRQHGAVFKTRLFGDNVICFVGPEAFSFFTDARYFTRKASSPPHLQALLHPDAIPFLDGERQQRRRRLMLQAFTPAAMAACQPIVERIIERTLERFASAGEVRAADELGGLGFTLANALFAAGDPDRDDPALAAAFARLMAGITAVPVKLPFTTYGRAIKARDLLREHLARAVDAYVPGAGDHVLDRLVRARDADGRGLELDEVKIEALHFFGASYAGLQAGLTGIVRALAEHPALAAAARAELAEHAPTGPLGDRLARLARVHRLGLEVRRHARIAPSTFFATVREDCEFAGHRIPGGWKAVAVPHSTMRDDAVFARAAEFDPDRFAPGRSEHERRPNSYVPHGGGPMDGHRCAGEALATLVLDCFTALALRRLEWTLPAQDLGEEMAGLASLPRDHLRTVFRRRAGAAA